MRPALRRTDDGSILVLVLVFVLVLGVLAAATARFVTTDLRYGSVVQNRAQALATAESGMEYAVDRIQHNSSGCELGVPTQLTQLPPTMDGTTLTVECSPIGSGFDSGNAWSAIVTGENAGASQHLRITGGEPKTIIGRMFMTDPLAIRVSGGSPSVGSGGVLLQDGNLFFDGTADGCGTGLGQTGSITLPDINTSGRANNRFFLTPPPPKSPGALICLPSTTWQDIAVEPPVPNLAGLFPTPVDQTTAYWVDDVASGCRVFEPGHYTQPIAFATSNYFKSGVYRFSNVPLTIGDAVIVGAEANANISTILTNGSGDPLCESARQADEISGGRGATWYLEGTSKITIGPGGQLEMLPMIHTDAAGTEYYMSVHHVVSNPAAENGTSSIIDVNPGSNKEAVFQGRVWVPYRRVTFDNVTGGANGQLLGGVVAASLWGDSQPSTNGFAIQVATSPSDFNILVTATGETNGVTASVQAVVEHRAEEDYADRTAVNSLRVL